MESIDNKKYLSSENLLKAEINDDNKKFSPLKLKFEKEYNYFGFFPSIEDINYFLKYDSEDENELKILYQNFFFYSDISIQKDDFVESFNGFIVHPRYKNSFAINSLIKREIWLREKEKEKEKDLIYKEYWPKINQLIDDYIDEEIQLDLFLNSTLYFEKEFFWRKIDSPEDIDRHILDLENNSFYCFEEIKKTWEAKWLEEQKSFSFKKLEIKLKEKLRNQIFQI